MQKFALVVLLVAVVTCSASDLVKHYRDYSVFAVRASNETQLRFIEKLKNLDVDFWREADRVNRIAHVMIPPKIKTKLLRYFDDHGLQLVESERQQQKKADKKIARLVETSEEAIPGFWLKYQRYDQHMALLEAFAQKNPSIVETITFGQSFEGRALKAVRIGVPSNNTQKQVIWIEGGIHAREWISPAAVTYFAQQLVNRYNSGEQEIKQLLAYYDFYVAPVLNADGYEFTHTSNRMWRKTRQPSKRLPDCIGADANRNYGYEWGGEGASDDPCSDTFRGDAAFSEPEAKAEGDYLMANFAGRFSAFLAIHSYGQFWLYPWGYKSNLHAPNEADLNRVAKLAVAAWNQVSPTTEFRYGNSADVLYAAAGGADDFAYGSAGAKYSYTVECPDKWNGQYGFQLPASQIVPVGQALTSSLIAVAQAVKGR
ncbi:hypothetical protein TYRP_009056 [Tyrophagus putrescentiae]|nr:hypothetical protein TYRP_009056 [Tyrophagus putrescentiae]